MRNKNYSLIRDILLVLASIIFIILVVCFEEQKAVQQLVCFILILLCLFLSVLFEIKIVLTGTNEIDNNKKPKEDRRRK